MIKALFVFFLMLPLAYAQQSLVSFGQGEKAEVPFGESITKVAGLEDFLVPNGNALSINIPKGGKVGLYFGKVFAANKSIPFVLEVTNSGKELKLSVDASPKRVKAGDTLTVNDKLSCSCERKQVFLKYILRDLNGIKILEEERTAVITKEISLGRSILIPNLFKAGTYIFSEEALFDNKDYIKSFAIEVEEGESAAEQEVTKENYFAYIAVMFSLLFIALVMATLVVYKHFKYKRMGKMQKKRINAVYEELKEKKSLADKKKKLKMKLTLLREAYKGRYIAKGTYDKGKKRISKLLKGMR